ncbi:FAD-dependent oxidoreductase, partial [Pseudomonas syringae pv. tagetis]
LPRLLEVDAPSGFPVRQAVFTHMVARIESPPFDRQKILVSIHPQHSDVCFWSIPFSEVRCSIGVVASPERFKDKPD